MSSRTAKSRVGRRSARLGVGLILPVVLIIVWQLVKSTGMLSYQDIPAPSTIWSATVAMADSGELSGNVEHTLAACLGGWALGSVVGLLLGLLLGLSQRAFTYSMASVDVLRAIPAIAFVPVAVIVFAQTLQMEIVIAAWVSVWPVAISTIDGVRGVSSVHQDLARSLRLSAVQRTVKFALPTAMPKILVALRLSLSAALVLAIVAEIVGNPDGIGYALVQEQQSLRPDAMFSYILITGLLGLILNFVLTWVLEHFVPGGRSLGNGDRHDDQ
ncbi:MAG TPA: ABC transporter permease subunit [Pseudonocardiaceae bacterium]|nr:ABC transporter permease subunit [Pseudonocardiaceae bacterium]